MRVVRNLTRRESVARRHEHRTHEAYRILLARGFRTTLQGVAMHRPNAAAYSKPDLFVIDDWR